MNFLFFFPIHFISFLLLLCFALLCFCSFCKRMPGEFVVTFKKYITFLFLFLFCSFVFVNSLIRNTLFKMLVETSKNLTMVDIFVCLENNSKRFSPFNNFFIHFTFPSIDGKFLAILAKSFPPSCCCYFEKNIISKLKAILFIVIHNSNTISSLSLSPFLYPA